MLMLLVMPPELCGAMSYKCSLLLVLSQLGWCSRINKYKLRKSTVESVLRAVLFLFINYINETLTELCSEKPFVLSLGKTYVLL